MTRSPYVTTRRLYDLASWLGPRDWTVLATLRRVRLASARQLERLCYADVSPRRARQSLARLTERGVLARLPRLVGGRYAGSAGYVYSLDIAGYRLINPGRIPRRPNDPGGRFLAHSLNVTELYARLIEADRTDVLDLRDFVAEPQCWRPFTGAVGRAILKPDAALIVRHDRFEDRWFCEVDRATEAVSVVARKCESYRRYWMSGTEQAKNGVFPRVLWLVPSEERKDALVGVFGQLPVVAWPLFTVALFDEAVARITRGAHV
jgi:hypothetical protein